MKKYGESESVKSEDSTPRISLTLGKITESHFMEENV